MSKKKIRRKFFIDPKVQSSLVCKAIVYWCLGLLALSGPIILFEIHPGNLIENGHWTLIRPVLITSFALLPIVILSVVKHSNKIVGPMSRMRQMMQQAKAGEPVEPIRLRKGDFWHDFAEDLNGLIELAQQQACEQPSVDAAEPEHEVSSV